MRTERERLRQEIIQRIENAFPGAIVRWVSNGSPDDDYIDDTERFEAYMIVEEDSGKFEDFVWDLHIEIGKPNGFSLMVHDLDPETTNQYRSAEYEVEKQRRLATYPVPEIRGKLFSWESRAVYQWSAQSKISSEIIALDSEIKDRAA